MAGFAQCMPLARIETPTTRQIRSESTRNTLGLQSIGYGKTYVSGPGALSGVRVSAGEVVRGVVQGRKGGVAERSLERCRRIVPSAETAVPIQRVSPRTARGSFRDYLHRHPRVRWFAYLAVFLMVASAFSGTAHASSPSSPPKPYSLPIVSNFIANPDPASVGAPVSFHFSVVGGILGGLDGSANFLVDSGYHVLWFFGGSNAKQDIVEKTQNVSAPTGCLSSTTPCRQATAVSENYTYVIPGSYNVSVTVYDAAFNYTIATTTVVVTSGSLSVQITQPCASPQSPGQVCGNQSGYQSPPNLINTPIEFSASASPYLAYHWDFGDGNDSGKRLPTHAYARNGTYMVTLTVSDSASGQSARAFLNVSVILLPITIPCLGNGNGWPASGVAGVPVGFDFPASWDPNPDDARNLTVGWNFGDGTGGEGLSTTHVFTQSGNFGPSISAISDLNAVPPIQRTTCNQVGITITGSLSILHNPGPTVPVGTVAFPDATHYADVPTGSALLNYSWSAPSGPSYGRIGRVSSFTPGNETLNLTVHDPYATQDLQTFTLADFTDVRPTVAFDSLYTQTQITVSIGNTYAAENVTIVLLENGHNVSWYNLWWDPGSQMFLPIDLQMADQWAIEENYTPYSGSSGSSTVTTEFDWYSANGYVDSTYASHTFYNTDPPSQDTYQTSINSQALGQPFFATETLFSPAQTSFNESVSIGAQPVQYYNDPAPPVAEPTLDTYPWTGQFSSGSNTTINITACDAWDLCGSMSLTVDEYTGFIVNDLAPAVSAPVQTPMVDSVPGTLNTFVANVTSNVPANTSIVNWQFGDGSTAKYLHVGNNSTTTHVYQYGARYAVVVYASSPCTALCPLGVVGMTAANWTWITVADVKSEPNFTVSDSAPLIYQTVSFNGDFTRENGQMGLDNLSFSWEFGDGDIAQGYGAAGALESHFYSNPGTYTVTLTVQDPDGVSNSTSRTLTVGATAPSFAFPSKAMTVDSFTVFTPPYPGLTSSPFVRAAWDWGDGTQTTGFAVGHTYIKPGVYTATLSLSGGVFGYGTAKSASLSAKDVPLTVVIPNPGYIAYGENHSESFSVQVLGSYADSYPTNYSLGNSSFLWQWGDGSANASAMNATGSDSASHYYNLTGIFALTVSVDGPYATGINTNGTATSYVSSVPDSDGDGVPNAYETAITHTNPYWPQNATKSTSHNGTGLTDYVGSYFTYIGSLGADPDADGLTTLQEIMGSVTGFPSNPLDANTAGDGIPDGSHYFSESFRNDNVSSFITGPGSNATNISDVWYAGPARSFHQANILVQVSTSAQPSQVSLTLWAPGGSSITLTGTGGMNSSAQTFLLVNSTPTGGEQDLYGSYGLTLKSFEQEGTWRVSANAGGVSGQIVEANIALSYYTNPSLADPTHQGLLQGHGITVPLVNCSEPWNASYPKFDPTTWTLSPLIFAPFTEQYYKLSVVQGVPYVPGFNQSLYNANAAAYDNGTCNHWGVSNSVLGDTASYLGDADFGISPWVSDVTGGTQPDGAPLTNGMKALGYVNYTHTADTYLTYQSGVPANSTDHGYPTDIMNSYPYPLNPMVLSTQYDGAPDGFAVARSGSTSPLSLAITIRSATDGNCYEFNRPSDQISVAVQQQGDTTPVEFTEARYPNASSSSYSCTYINSDFSFYDSYTMPLNNSQTEFNLTFTLWHNSDPEGDNKASWAVSDQTVGNGYSSSIDNTNGGTQSGVNATWRVEPTPRAPVVFVANAGETQMLPGYGLHYVGEQQFYAFYLSVTGSSSGPQDPFQPGGSQGALNVILISRASYLTTNLSANLSANTLNQSLPALAGCLGPSQITTRDSGGSHLSLAGTLAATMSDSCANLLLQNLMPYGNTTNSTGNTTWGVTGTYYALDTSQLQLLGFDADASQVAPFLPIPGFNSPLGGEPAGFDWNIFAVTGGVIVAAGNFFQQPAIVTVGDWVAGLQTAVAQAYAALGQAVLGVLVAVGAAFADITLAEFAIFGIFLQVADMIFEQALNLLLAMIGLAVTSVSIAAEVPVLSYMYQSGVINVTVFNAVINATPIWNQTHIPPVTLSDAESLLGKFFLELEIESAAAAAGVTIANYVVDGITSGGAAAAKAGAQSLVDLTAKKTFVRLLKFALTTVGTGVAFSILGAVLGADSSTLTQDLKDIGIGASVASFLVGALLLIRDFPSLRTSLTAGAYAYLQVSFAIELFGAALIAISLFAKAVAPSVQAFAACLGLVFGTVALSYTVSVDYMIESEVEQSFPLDAVGIAGAGLEVEGSAAELATISLS